jgi:hypothetical protein
MSLFSVRRRPVLAVSLAAVALTVACEDKRVKELDTGISRDSAVKVISQDAKPAENSASGPAKDSLTNVFMRERYLIQGKNYEVLYFTPKNDKIRMPPGGGMPPPDSIPYAKLTPLVFIGDRLAGRGWPFWDSLSTANKIPLKKR